MLRAARFAVPLCAAALATTAVLAVPNLALALRTGWRWFTDATVLATIVSLAGFPIFVLIGRVHAAARARAPVPPADSLPAVTLLKPCAGLDDDLEACVASYCAQEYPAVQVLFGVARANDPALPVLERVLARHPQLDAQIVVCGPARHASPKVSILATLVASARHDVLWLSDSNTRASPNTLRALVAALDAPEVACVGTALVGDGERTLASAWENVHLTLFAGAGTFTAHAVTGLVGTGKSLLLRRDALDAVGGFATLGDYAGDDIVLLRALRSRGYRVALAREPAVSVSRDASWSHVLARHLRWTRIRLCAVPLAAALEPLLSPIVPAAFALALAPHGANALLFAGALVEQLVADVTELRRTRNRLAARDVALVLARPYVNLALWCAALFARRFAWRGRRFRIGRGSAIAWVDPTSPSHATHPIDTFAP